ncbi:hypothetical protein ACLM5J_00255 [Nocardioides sp. Bht2]|uniref:arsenate reductase/protein-tyrosine-phosphatase family protein n=1 Tax=Nocardioides sp. Bht2 TaxID=3392297 RepID=UPI0039B69742
MRPTVLFVCVANICRSPVAERLFELRLADAGFPGAIEVASAGVRALEGREMAPESLRTLTERGAATGSFGARLCSTEMLAHADLVLTATRGIRSSMLAETPQALRRSFTITEFVALSEHVQAQAPVADLAALIAGCAQIRGSVPVAEYDVADPYGRSAAHFDTAAEQIDAAVARIAAVLGPLAVSATA